MALHHHGASDYAVAASEAAAHARTIMEKKIYDGVKGAQSLVDHVFSSVPQDAVARGRAVRFVAGDAPGLQVTIGSNAPLALHKNALQQLAGTTGLPFAYAQDMAQAEEPWKRVLVGQVLGEHMHREHGERKMLFRAVNGELRAQLSDRYRRLDSRPLLEDFVAACAHLGAIPCDGNVTDTRLTLKAYLPMVFEPVPGEVMCFGIEFFNSDFGRGRFGVRATVWRLWCTNKATLEDSLAQVHFGGRLDESIEFSENTQRLDTDTARSALRDVVHGALGPAKVARTLALIQAANEQNIPWQGVSRMLGKVLTKAESTRVREDFEGDDVVMLPAGKSVWRASNAVSLLAGKVQDPERRIDLERLAGAMLTGKRGTDVLAPAGDD